MSITRINQQKLLIFIADVLSSVEKEKFQVRLINIKILKDLILIQDLICHSMDNL